MSLLSLPNELVEQVVEEAFPEDLKSVMLSCRRLHDVGMRYIEFYNAQRSRFGKLRIHAGCDISWLADLAKEPTIPSYITMLDLQGTRRLDKSRPMLCAKEIRPHVEALVGRSPYMASNGVDQGFWVKNIMGLARVLEYIDTETLGLSSWDPSTSMVPVLMYMTLFPNVTHLTLPWIRVSPIPITSLHDDDRYEQEQCDIVFDAISQQARSYRGCGALSKLRYLFYQIPGSPEVYSLIQVILPYITLPALEELHAKSLLAIEINEFQFQLAPVKWLQPDAYSNLQTICFRHCCMSAIGISKILAHTPRLTTFRHGHEMKYDTGRSYEVFWDAGAFVAAVEKHVGAHLRHLTVEIEGSGADGILEDVTTMHGFTKLETLELDLEVLTGNSQFMLRNTPVRPLSEILPPCIRRFALLGKMEGEDDYGRMDVAVELYRGFKSVYRSRLPNLDSYSVRFYSILDDKRKLLRKEQKSAFEAEAVVVSWGFGGVLAVFMIGS
ncbi:hypothetical protein F5Y08DRAFT_333277 [Xylaria arbuscula]|nr:hypothetical protein F5Y08DRAFT_333277 [Xylaria arbuscula]